MPPANAPIGDSNDESVRRDVNIGLCEAWHLESFLRDSSLQLWMTTFVR